MTNKYDLWVEQCRADRLAHRMLTSTRQQIEDEFMSLSDDEWEALQEDQAGYAEKIRKVRDGIIS